MVRISHEARARLEAFKEVRVKHPRLEDVDRLVTQAIEEHAGYSHLLVYGPRVGADTPQSSRRPGKHSALKPWATSSRGCQSQQ